MLDVTSSAFGANETIPPKYTCDGEGIAPPLAWSNVPEATRSVAILVDDPDAPDGPFTHWLVTDLPPTARTLAEGGALPREASTATTDAGNTSYYGQSLPHGSIIHGVHQDRLCRQLQQELMEAAPDLILGYGERPGFLADHERFDLLRAGRMSVDRQYHVAESE
jgi:Raf kinase inhibitor-like YbhB/YbcL family protein